MRPIFIVPIVCVGLLILPVLFGYADNRYQVSGYVIGLSGNHIAYVGLFTRAAWERDHTHPSLGVQIQPSSISNGRGTYQFTVPPGDYVISVFEDKDNNNRLSTNLFGIPTEPFGFFQHYEPGVRGPRFHEFRFSVNRSITNANIVLQNR